MTTDLITIAIPLYNETHPAEKTIAEAYELDLNKEILVINDGSTLPETLKILAHLKKKFPSIRFIDNKQNIGKARSIQKAIREAHGNIFVILDSDYELDPQDIVPLYRTLISSGASLVNGYRVVKDRERNIQYTSLFSKFSRFFMLFWTRVLYGTSVGDVLSGYKMFYTHLFKDHAFSSKRFGLETEFIVETINANRAITEIDVSYFPRSYKEGKKINVFDSIEIMLVLAMKSRWYMSLRKFFIPIGICLMSMCVYASTMRYYPTTDSLPNTLTSLSLMQHRSLKLDAYVPFLERSDLIGVAIQSSDASFYAKTSPIFGILSMPIIGLTSIFLGIPIQDITPSQPLFLDLIQTLGKWAGIFFTSLSAGLLYTVLRRLHIPRSSMLATTVIYIIGTQAFSVASQAHWQHGHIVCLTLLGLYTLLRSQHSRFYMIITGILFGLMATMRISTILLSIVPLLYIWSLSDPKIENIRRIMLFGFSALSTIGGIMIMLALIGVPFGYGNELLFSLHAWNPILFIQNATALLVSPNLGLFSAYPILLLVIPGTSIVFKRGLPIGKAISYTLIAHLVFTASWWMWSGGYSPSGRLLIDILPLMMVLVAYALTHVSKTTLSKSIVICLFLFSATYNIVSVFMADSSWHDRVARPGHTHQLELAWSNDPTWLQHHIRNQMFYVTWLHKQDSTVVQRNVVLRPSLQYKGIVTLFDGERKLFSQ